MTAIPIGPDSISLPKGMFQGGKTPGMMVTGETVTPWYWEGIKTIQGTLCVYSSTKNIKPFSMLFNLNIPLSSRLDLFVQVLQGMKVIAEQDESPWFLQGFPLNAVWIIPGSGILVLPRAISSVMMNAVSEKERDALENNWVHPKAPEDKRWLYQMTAVLYAVLGKVPPLEDEYTREAGYEPLPLWTLNPSVSDSSSDEISSWLTLKKPLPEADELASFVREHASQFCASVPSAREVQAKASYEAARQKIHTRGRRRVFFRKRGFVLAVTTLLAVILIAGVTTRIVESLRPPDFAGMEPVELINHFYDLQDRLQMGEMGDMLTRSAKNVREEQMIYLHVTNAMRTAYGGGEMMPAWVWVKQGKPEIPPDTMVYGITDLEITKVEDLVFEARFNLWLPGAPDGNEMPAHGIVEGIRYVERLVLEDRDTHFMIRHIEVMEQEPLT